MQVRQGKTGAAADAAFHSSVAVASHNQALVSLSTTLVELLAPMRDETFQTPERSFRSLSSHLAILDAILRGDVEATRRAMEDHILSVDRSLSGNKPGRSLDSVA